MKKFYPFFFPFICLVLCTEILSAQCTNADFGSGSFANWTGTWGDATCSYTVYSQNAGFVQGPLNDPPSDATTQYHQVICSTAGGNDPNLTLYGATLPMVWPGDTYSGRIGNMWQKVGHNSNGNGETITYALTVTPTNCVFIYHYAVVLYDGGHPTGQQPFFNIKATDGNGNDIACGDYEVDATTAHTIGGFNHIASQAIYWKPWTSVLLPLLNYVGQTVQITFTTRGCEPNGCAGSHYAYAYIDAECGPPTLVASSPQICGTQGVTLTAPAGAATYSWTGPNISSGTNTQTVTITQPGRDTVTMTTLATPPCTYTIDTFIPGNPASPTANFSYSPTCVGTATNFSDLSTPLITGWSWNFNNGAGTSTIQNPSFTFADTGTFPVSLSIVSGSCAADTTLNVVVLPSPNSPFTATGPVCADINSAITYTGTAPANATYNWNFAGGTIVSGAGQGPYQVNWPNGGTQNITLQVTQGACSSPVTTVPVVVNPYPVLTITPNQAICIGSSANLLASGAAAYAWSNTTTTPGIVVTPVTTTTYSVTGTTNNCSASIASTVTVNPIPTSTFTVTTPVCPGQNSTFTYSGNASATAYYAWNFAGVLPGDTLQGPQTASWNNPGPQNISLTVTQSGCQSPVTNMTVVVDTTPSSAFNVITPICFGQTDTVTYTGGANNTASFAWNFAGGTATPGTGAGPQTVTWTSPGSKYITLLVTENNCPSLVTTELVSVHPIPTANFTVATPLCINESGAVRYTGTSSAISTMTWNFDGGVITSGAGRGPFEVSWANAGTFNVSLAVTDSGCIAIPDTLPVTVNPSPVSIAGDDTALCAGNQAQIGTASTAGYTYLWSPSTGLSDTTVSNPMVNLINNSPDFPVTQTYRVITTSLGCTNSAAVAVTVNPIPVAEYTPPASRCLKRNDFPFTALGNYMASASFMWHFGSLATPDSSVFPNQTVVFNAAGTYPVSLTITQSSTHCANTFTDTVTVYPMPAVSFNPDTVKGCQNFEVCFGDSSVTDIGSTYLWNFGDGEASDDSAPCHKYVYPGIYTVYLKITSPEGCEHDTTEPNLITVVADPTAQFVPSATEIQQPEAEVDFANTSYNAVSYLWSINSVGAIDALLDSTSDLNTSYNFTQYGLYNVVLWAKNSLGCIDSTLQSITVTPPQNFFIPNAFTPNGDGKNDNVYVYAQEGVTVLWFKIFDRTGEKVHDGLYPWDGTFRGKPCPPAVYVYEAGFNLVDKSVDIVRKGSITLIR